MDGPRSRSLRSWPMTRARPYEPRRTCTRERPQESVHQDPWYSGGDGGDRGVDLRRRSGERDPAVVAEQYLAAADAYMRGIERRVVAGLDPAVGSVASVFMSRWDAEVLDRVPNALHGRLAIAIGLKSYQAYREVMNSQRWQRR